MKQITKVQYWHIQEKIKHNNHLKEVGDLWYSADITGTRYKDKDNKIIAKSSKEGYFIDERLEVLL